MNSKFRYSLLWLTWALVGALNGMAQVDTTRRQSDTLHLQPDTSRRKLLLFAPLYLDSAFDAGGNYRYDKNFPKFINPGLEFYEGAQMALDTLQKEHVALDVEVFDTRSSVQTLQQMLDSPNLKGAGLIIGQVNNAHDLQLLSAAAARRNIPFINANYPNDAGITNNPDLVILNSTLRTHCEGIYRWLQRNYPTKPLTFFRRKGAQEDRLRGYFTDIGKTTAGVPLKINYITLDDGFDAQTLASNLDSLQQTVCISGSLDEAFGFRLCALLATLSKSYRTILVGMPTWDSYDWTKPEYSGEEIVYSTPFYINPSDTLVRIITQNFNKRFYSRPSDMVFRGYECTYRFAKLLLLHGPALSGSIGERRFKVFNDLEILPVFLNRQTMVLDYFENRKLYFIHKLDGNVTGVN
ncbi:MAG TPA: hypothetical protein VNU70_10290 [Puia sp.]|jgi:hypothetical protein|nr:hypothetical protein [Puia sp.]